MKLPTTVTIGPHTYTVACTQPAIDAASRKEGADLYGHTDHGTLQISIAPDLADDRTRDTLTHELLHTLTALTGLDADLGKDEEQFVNRLAPALLTALRTNPEAVTYLTA